MTSADKYIHLIFFAGFLYEMTGSYELPFYVAGGLITFSAVLCYPLNIIKNWQDAKRKVAASA